MLDNQLTRRLKGVLPNKEAEVEDEKKTDSIPKTRRSASASAPASAGQVETRNLVPVIGFVFLAIVLVLSIYVAYNYMYDGSVTEQAKDALKETVKVSAKEAKKVVEKVAEKVTEKAAEVAANPVV